MISEQLLELEQEHIAEEKARKKETAGEEKEPPRKFTMNDLAFLLQTSAHCIKSLKMWTQTPEGSQ